MLAGCCPGRWMGTPVAALSSATQNRSALAGSPEGKGCADCCYRSRTTGWGLASITDRKAAVVHPRGARTISHASDFRKQRRLCAPPRALGKSEPGYSPTRSSAERQSPCSLSPRRLSGFRCRRPRYQGCARCRRFGSRAIVDQSRLRLCLPQFSASYLPSMNGQAHGYP